MGRSSRRALNLAQAAQGVAVPGSPLWNSPAQVASRQAQAASEDQAARLKLGGLTAQDLQGRTNAELAQAGVAIPGSPIYNAPAQVDFRTRLKNEALAGQGTLLPPAPSLGAPPLPPGTAAPVGLVPSPQAPLTPQGPLTPGSFNTADLAPAGKLDPQAFAQPTAAEARAAEASQSKSGVLLVLLIGLALAFHKKLGF